MQRVPVLLTQFQNEGSSVKEVTLQDTSLQKVLFPKINEKSVVVFWATWCGPCTLELSRINKAIINKEINASSIYAINMGEEPTIANAEAKKRDYKFSIYYDLNLELIKQLNVAVTPTIAFIDQNKKIEWLSSGISPSLIFRIQSFLSK